MAGCIAVAGLLMAVSLWEQDHFFQRNVAVGEVIRVHFQEKRLISLDNKLKKSDNQKQSGKTLSGEAWGFLPSGLLGQQDSRSGHTTLSIKQMQDFYISARVLAVTNQQVYLEGRTTTAINGEILALVLTGQSDLYRIKPDRTLFSHDLYNLRFAIQNSVEQDSALSMEDLIFVTNYSEIQTNLQIQNGLTNLQYVTNNSSLDLKFKGIQDDRKKQMVLFYVNALIQDLFY